MMRAIIWKEVRENAKWAALGMLGLAAAMTFALATRAPRDVLSVGHWISCPRFYLVTVFGSALIGSGLGLLQVVMESRREQWAFLLHRPVSRSSLFFGKVTAGLALYLPAVSIPFAGAVVWAATPGHVPAPFDWRMTLGGMADLLAGTAHYFGAMAIGLRQARWFGSRALPLAAAWYCSLLVVLVPQFWLTIVIIGLTVALLLVVAWGSFLVGGSYGPLAPAFKAALGLSLTIGLAVVAIAGFRVAHSLFGSKLHQITWYAIDNDGTIVRITRDRYRVTAITDPQGHPLEKYKNVRLNVEELWTQLLPQVTLPFDFEKRDLGVGFFGYRASLKRLVPVTDWADLNVWVYSSRDGLIHGYEAMSKRFIGTISPSGFAGPRTKAADRFGPLLPGSGWLVRPIASPSAVYLGDFTNRRVRRVFSAPTDDKVVNAGAVIGPTRYSANRGAGTYVAVATTKRIHLLEPDGRPVISAAIEHDTNVYAGISVARLPDGSRCFIIYAPSGKLPIRERAVPHYVVEYGPDGKVRERHELPPLPVNMPEMPGFMVGAAAIGSLGGVVTGTFHWWLEDRRAAVIADVFSNAGPWLTAVWIATVLAAVGSAVGCRLLARRSAYGRLQTIGWVTVCVLIGPVGLLLLWSIHDWPAREVCSACGIKRVVVRDECEHCNAPFVAPATDGTEIFA